MERRAMEIRAEFQNGQPVVDSADIAPLLELDVVGFQALMKSGKIKTGVERGSGQDEGKLRLTFQSSHWRVRLTCACDGQVLTTTRLRMGAGEPASTPETELRMTR